MRYSVTRGLLLTASFAFACLLAACGGGGGGTAGPLPDTPGQPSIQSTPPAAPGTSSPQTSSQGSGSYDSLIQSAGPVEYYRLDETSGTAATDSSGHSANAAYLGTAGSDYQQGQVPGPITQESQGWFESLGTGTSHGVKAPAVAGASTTSSWTLEAWLKLAAMPAGFATIAGSAYNDRLLVTHSGTLLYQGPSGNLSSARSLLAGQVYHIVLKSDLSVGANGTVSVSINGIKDANTFAYPAATGRQGFVSAYYLGQYDTSANYKLNGYLGRVAYYTAALPDAQISAHYAQGVSSAATPPPAPTPTPAPTIATKHVLVGGYIYGYAGTPTTVPLSSITPYVNWAQTDQTHAPILRAAGMKVDVYARFWRNYTVDNPNIGYLDLEPGGAHASAEALSCSGAPLVDPSYGTGYEADPRTSSALAHAQVVATYRENSYHGNYDALISDQTGVVGGMPQPCGYVQAAWDAATNAVHAALGVPLFINALGGFSNPASAIDLANPSNVLGAMCEECYTRNGTSGDTLQTGGMWQNVENAEIGMVNKHKIFWAYPRAVGDPTTELGIRMYAVASFLLTYDPAYAMLEEAFATPSGFPVMPESQLVPTQPLTTSTTTVNGYLSAGGAYWREFGACYYQGALVSRCAVAVNPTTATVPLPGGYTHSLVLSGSGVLDGGTAGFNGPQVSQLGPGSAAIVFP